MYANMTYDSRLFKSPASRTLWAAARGLGVVGGGGGIVVVVVVGASVVVGSGVVVVVGSGAVGVGSTVVTAGALASF